MEGILVERRIHRILEYVQLKTDFFSPGESVAERGVTTVEIAETLGIQRTNCSKDLNQLVREGLIIKSETRPVRYWVPKDQSCGAEQLAQSKSRKTSAGKKAVPAPAKASGKPKTDETEEDADIFTQIIGSNGSMKNSIEQARAAILYPPKGLNCLITGPTGSGKTHFAHAMFRYAKASGVVNDHQELVVFNCADYANNPELLMSHLFGHAKGAFTGAEADKEGIIDQADGGMLFLDEIHRLPPEGQEMIFYLMDYGAYNRMGESGKTRQAEVRIVGATTEDPSSSLLDTFVRRIPISIQLPSFGERPATEQIDLVKLMYAIEADRIQRKITISEDVVKAMIGSVTYGNIGQLKSNVQLVCAHAFMNQFSQPELSITVEDLTEGIKSGLVQLAGDREALAEVAKNLEPKITISPNVPFLKLQRDAYELPYNLYDIIGDKAALLKAEGMSQDAINQFISTDINVHLKSFYRDHGFTFEADNKLAEFVDPKIIELTEQIFQYVSQALNYSFQQNFIYAMSLHISSFIRKINVGEERGANDNIRAMADDFPQEFAIASKIRQEISERFELKIPESEIYYLTVLLVSLKNKQKTGRVGVVVAAHGNSTASSMSQVVKKLLNTDLPKAVDMPLEMSPTIAYEKVKQKVTEADEGNGVLFLVDMGSLTSFAGKIQDTTGIMVRTIDMVTTPLVLEAVRKASVIGTDLAELYDSLHGFQGYAESVKSNKKQVVPENKVILAICSSGEGTAQRIKEIIEEAVQNSAMQTIGVETASVINIEETIQEIQINSEIIAVTGIIDPKIDAPFLPLEKFINQDVQMLLEDLVLDNDLNEISEIEVNEDSAKKICIDYMSESYTFINGAKLIEPLWQFVDGLFKAVFKAQMDYSSYINLAIHMAGALERIVLNEPLTVEASEIRDMLENPNYELVHQFVMELQSSIHVQVPQVEEYFVIQFLENQMIIR